MKYIFQRFWRLLLVIPFLIVCVFLLVNIVAHPHITTNQNEIKETDAAIVLGAGLITSEKLSPIFKDRVDTAITLYKEGKVRKILVTGDDGTEEHNEVTPAGEYLLTQGIPSNDIFLDHAGFDTYSSMYRAREVFLIRSGTITTQSFHLPRAVFIARMLGIDAYGVPADQHAYSYKNNIREILADVKAVLDIITRRIPKYLGKEIPITGDAVEPI
jgi:SanA protein